MKTCNAQGYCPSQVMGFSSHIECTYKDFCDFQLPRDSRGKDGRPIVDAMEIHSTLEGQLVCTCNTTAGNKWCPVHPIHGAKK